MINQLPVFAAEKHHRSWICVATFIYWKIVIANDSTTAEARENINTDQESLDFYK
jgi:hypothetical protein